MKKTFYIFSTFFKSSTWRNIREKLPGVWCKKIHRFWILAQYWTQNGKFTVSYSMMLMKLLCYRIWEELGRYQLVKKVPKWVNEDCTSDSQAQLRFIMSWFIWWVTNVHNLFYLNMEKKDVYQHYQVGWIRLYL